MKHKNCHILSHINYSASGRHTEYFGASLCSLLGSHKEPAGKGAQSPEYGGCLSVNAEHYNIVIICSSNSNFVLST